MYSKASISATHWDFSDLLVYVSPVRTLVTALKLPLHESGPSVCLTVCALCSKALLKGSQGFLQVPKLFQESARELKPVQESERKESLGGFRIQSSCGAC